MNTTGHGMTFRRVYFAAAGLAVLAMCSSALPQGWPEFGDETAERLVSSTELGATDPEEKDYAWGDFDKDGDVDLAVARKQPATSIGRKRNILFMNENGVLVDRTEEYATASNDGSQGFLDLTNDRDIVATDVDGDGWLDLVTAPTYGQGLPKTISHPRVYMNQGATDGQWNGFLYEEDRFPEFPSWPNFCGVAAGDVTGDGFPDLYFTDYDSLQQNTFEDRLMINLGNGFFSDQSAARMPNIFLDSGFGIHVVIEDLNNDGWNDVIKNEAGSVRVAYNGGDGFFDSGDIESPYGGAAYFFNTGDLNSDGLLDIVISDDGIDVYQLNQGNGDDGFANFINFQFPASTNGFGSNSIIADLDQDGFNDVLIADFDVDVDGCAGVSDILRNNANSPFVAFTAPATGIPSNLFNGVHDLGVFDVNGDCWLDVVVGRCAGTTVWINQGDGTDCSNIITPNEFDAFRGFHLSGDLGDVLASDDNDLCYNPGITIFPSEAPVTLDFVGVLPNDSPASLDVTIESSANTVGLGLTFSFWNYNTNSWDVVGTDTQSLNADAARTFAGVPANHVEPGTGEVRTRYEVRQVSFIFVFPWADCVDHVFWTID